MYPCVLCTLLLPAVILVAGLTVWIITGLHNTARGQQQQWVVLPHAVNMFVKHSTYSEAAIKKALAEGTPASKYRRATPAELKCLKQQGAVGRRVTLVNRVRLQG